VCEEQDECDEEEELERVHDQDGRVHDKQGKCEDSEEVDRGRDAEQEENALEEEYDKQVCRRSRRRSSSVCTTRGACELGAGRV